MRPVGIGADCVCAATAALFSPGCRVALVVNNLGATPPMEMSLVAGEAVAAAEQQGVSSRQGSRKTHGNSNSAGAVAGSAQHS